MKKSGAVCRHIKEVQEYLVTPDEAKNKRSLRPFARLSGHTGSIEGLQFKPESQYELVSVGVDKMVMFWDTRIYTDVKTNSGSVI